ncbi:MAG: PAS domain S-box protein [Thermoguttaceae bacterium]|nr:PAS domain S-box protein [Thermoguttaceae bacterium]
MHYMYIVAVIIIASLIVLFFFRANMQLVLRCRALEHRLIDMSRHLDKVAGSSDFSPEVVPSSQQRLLTPSERDELFHIILDNIPYCILVKDVDHDFRHMLWNRELERQTGLTEAEMLGKTDFEIEPWPGLGKFIHELDQEAIRKGSIDHETLCETMSGKNIFYQTNKRVVKTRGGRTLILDMCRDISHEKEMQKSNAETIEKQQRLIDRYSAIYDCISFMTSETDVKKIFNYIITRFGETENAQRAYLYFITESDHAFAQYVCQWCGPACNPIPDSLKTLSFALMPTAKQTLLMDRQITQINTAELADDSVFKKWVISEQIAFVLFAPIMYNDQLVGVVGFDYRKLQNVYIPTSLQIIQGAARLLAYVYARYFHEPETKEQERTSTPS